MICINWDRDAQLRPSRFPVLRCRGVSGFVFRSKPARIPKTVGLRAEMQSRCNVYVPMLGRFRVGVSGRFRRNRVARKCQCWGATSRPVWSAGKPGPNPIIPGKGIVATSTPLWTASKAGETTVKEGRMQENRSLTRRGFFGRALTGVAMTAGALAFGRRAAAQSKAPKQAVQYQKEPDRKSVV